MSKKAKTEVSTSKGETGLSLSKQFTKEDVPGMLEKVNAAIEAIKQGIPEKKQTTGDLDGFGPIDEIDSVEQLIKAHSSVTGRARAYEASYAALAAKSKLKKKAPKFTIGDHSEQAWLDDIDARCIVVEHQSELKKLEQVKTKLESHLSEESKLSKDLAEIGSILSED